MSLIIDITLIPDDIFINSINKLYGLKHTYYSIQNNILEYNVSFFNKKFNIINIYDFYNKYNNRNLFYITTDEKLFNIFNIQTFIEIKNKIKEKVELIYLNINKLIINNDNFCLLKINDIEPKKIVRAELNKKAINDIRNNLIKYKINNFFNI